MKITNKIAEIFGSLGGILVLAIWGLLLVGWVYWIWLAIKLGNFWMFVVGLFPLTGIFTAPVGAWSLLVGVPAWLL